MGGLQQEVVSQFIIDVTLIEPITEIVEKLTNHQYRDCDIKWLNKKLHGFAVFAANTLGVTGLISNEGIASEFVFINDYVRNWYLQKFNSLLDYFKTI